MKKCFYCNEEIDETYDNNIIRWIGRDEIELHFHPTCARSFTRALYGKWLRWDNIDLRKEKRNDTKRV